MLLHGNYLKFYHLISQSIDRSRIFTDSLRTLAYGTDASFYRLVPKIVIWANNADEVANIIKTASDLALPMVFRAAGTSLSGQAISDSILVVTSRDWDNISISKDKNFVSLAPSVIGLDANTSLGKFQKKIGPDPASINSAMIGGIVANNASGMCCGTEDNSYKTIKDIKLIFSDGSRLDTSSEQSKKEFEKTHKDLLANISSLAKKLSENKELKAKIIKKFQIKNTCGYGLNSLVDYEDVYEIIKHLMVGSEGTLGFIEEVTLKTIPDYKDKASGLIIFKNIKDACEAVAKLKLTCKDRVDAAELMDRRSLKSVENKEGMPPYLKTLSKDATALLIETRAKNPKILKENIDVILDILKNWDMEIPASFTTNVQEYTTFWNIRKGLFPAVGGVREVGTTVIIEDVAYPMEDFARGILDLKKIMKKHGYEDSIIFGHALDSNVHFVFTQTFETRKQKEQYDNFMQELSLHVASHYKGSLKAEHGTGRNMAPFVSLEWGEEAYEIMKEIKNIFDPHNLLNPGVIINKDPKAHLQNLKILPKTNKLVDMCIECGFCESVCPSNMLSLTPRQRIVANRKLSQLKTKDVAKFKDLKAKYTYDGLETCATCSLCFTRCPVGINMGDMTKYLRSIEATSFNKNLASFASSHYGGLLNVARYALKGLHVLSHLNVDFSKSVAKKIHKLSKNHIPLWNASLPSGQKPLKQDLKPYKSHKKVVYFSSCINQTFGNPKPKRDEKTIHEVVKSILNKAGYELIVPKYSQDLCCGMPFYSKGYKEEGDVKNKELQNALRIATNNGKYPIICDMSPCTKTMKSHLDAKLKIYGADEFVMRFLLDDLSFTKVDEPILIHKTCSTQTSGSAHFLEELANKCSHKVIIPKKVSCCGFAGDRGFTFPELNSSALRHLKEEIPKGVKLAFSTSKTCEIGLSEHSGLAYRNIMYLVDRCTKAKK
ncbi:MAG: 4Fe-4S ferredoxin [Proteobacteria bacterium]|nr:MAG: 4Fe-4S ferredoxin [Pseudomonadota bacterium]